MGGSNLYRYLHVLIGKRNIWRLSGAGAGALLGFFILMAAIQLAFDAQYFMDYDQDDLFDPGIVVINKKVSMLNTLGISNNTFHDEEIEELRRKSFVTRAEPFVPCRFKVSVAINLSGFEMPDFFSEFFFESVPDDLVDIPPSHWTWNPDSKVLPLVLPADFLKFYNFGFAPGQGLPQLSERALRLANLLITIDGNGLRYRLPGKIVGLSEKINTILVPDAFMTFANERYGEKGDFRPTRLIIVSETAADPNLAGWIREKNYETAQSELRSGKLNQMLRISLLITGLVGVVIVLLALYLFVLSFSLFIVRSDYEIRTLLQLGVSHKSLVRYLFRMLLGFIIVIFFVDSVLLMSLHQIVYPALAEKGIVIMESTNIFTYLYAAVLLVILLAVNYRNIKKNLWRLAGQAK